MADNSSSVSSSSDFEFLFCASVSASNTMAITIFAVKTILVLPLCTAVLYLSHRQRKQQLSFTTTSHADIFTYHMIAMQMIWFLSSFCVMYGKYANLQEMKILGVCLSLLDLYGEIFFQTLTCVERYLAVVHPITYLKLKQARGVRIRNISIGCAWLLSFTLMGLYPLYTFEYPSLTFLCILVFSLTVTSFCSLSILCVLIRPGPGEGSVNKERVDQSKQRAFCTVATIMGLLCLWFVGFLVSNLMERFSQIDKNVTCVMITATGWFNLPCSLLLPLLYLHRARKLPCCC